VTLYNVDETHQSVKGLDRKKTKFPRKRGILGVGMMVHACNPKSAGGRDRKIAV
jgi:hypothetical protein